MAIQVNLIVQAAVKAIPTIGKAGWKVLASLGAGAALAIAAAIKGSVDAKAGREMRKVALKDLEAAIASCEAIRVQTEQKARDYGEYQMLAHKNSVARFADWLERNAQLVKRLNFKKVDGVTIRVPNIPKYVASVENVTAGISGIASAVGAATSAQAAALWGVSAFASASTGTAISTLSGAAARSATLAWLGGGSIAAGGGGVAAGGAVLGLVMIVPAILVGGMTVGIMGSRAKTKSRHFAAAVTLEIERIGLAGDMLRATEQRIEELRVLLERLAKRAAQALDELEAFDFDPTIHAHEFLRAYQLVTAVKEILNTPVLDPKSGELTESSIEILRKYA